MAGIIVAVSAGLEVIGRIIKCQSKKNEKPEKSEKVEVQTVESRVEVGSFITTKTEKRVSTNLKGVTFSEITREKKNSFDEAEEASEAPRLKGRALECT